MRSKFHIFPIMIFGVVVVFGLKSYDFAVGFDAQNNTAEVAAMMESVSSAAGQEEEIAGTETLAANTAPSSDFTQGLPFTGEEIQLLQKLSERREELDQRSRDMDVREKLLIATENGIDKKIVSLKSIEEQIRALISIHDEQEEAQMDSLVATYSAMKAKDAAVIFNTLDMDIMIRIIEKMNPKKVADVLAKMNTASANQVTVQLATRKKLPNIEG